MNIVNGRVFIKIFPYIARHGKYCALLKEVVQYGYHLRLSHVALVCRIFSLSVVWGASVHLLRAHISMCDKVRCNGDSLRSASVRDK
jgi:hypothetical protein